MINVTLTNNRVKIKGHAEYAEIGKDIVCAAVSVLFLSVAQQLHGEKNVRMVTEGNDCYILVDKQTPYQALFMEYLRNSLRSVQAVYPDYIQIGGNKQ